MLQTPVGMDQFQTDDGSIDYGSLMRFYRKEVMQWKNAQILANIYNEVMGNEETISVRWIQRVEKENKVPIDMKRRWVIATLLNIPPASFGLEALRTTSPHYSEEITTFIATNTYSIDMKTYDKRLKTLWTSWMKYYTRKPVEFLEEIIGRIQTLEHCVVYGGVIQREQAALMLCNYLILFGNIRRDQGYLESARIYLNKAVALAKDRGYDEEYAKALYLRGYVFFDIWAIRSNQKDWTDLGHAINDFKMAQVSVHEAKKHKGRVSQPLQAAVTAELGLAQAYLANDEKDRTKALSMIDAAEHIISASTFERDWYFLHINDEWHIIDKAEAYNAIGWPKSALNEITNIDKGDGHVRRRYVYTDIIEAEANVACGRVEMGIACAEEALNVIEDIRSGTFLARVTHLYGGLKQNTLYSKSPDVARLGANILKVQHPELFE